MHEDIPDADRRELPRDPAIVVGLELRSDDVSGRRCHRPVEQAVQVHLLVEVVLARLDLDRVRDAGTHGKLPRLRRGTVSQRIFD